MSRRNVYVEVQTHTFDYRVTLCTISQQIRTVQYIRTDIEERKFMVFTRIIRPTLGTHQ